MAEAEGGTHAELKLSMVICVFFLYGFILCSLDEGPANISHLKSFLYSVIFNIHSSLFSFTGELTVEWRRVLR